MALSKHLKAALQTCAETTEMVDWRTEEQWDSQTPRLFHRMIRNHLESGINDEVTATSVSIHVTMQQMRVQQFCNHELGIGCHGDHNQVTIPSGSLTLCKPWLRMSSNAASWCNISIQLQDRVAKKYEVPMAQSIKFSTILHQSIPSSVVRFECPKNATAWTAGMYVPTVVGSPKGFHDQGDHSSPIARDIPAMSHREPDHFQFNFVKGHSRFFFFFKSD